MAEIYRTVVGNDTPIIRLTAKRNGTVINVTGATVSLAIRREKTGTTTNTGSQSCVLETPASGIVTYQPSVSDFPVEGRYIGDLKIVHLGGRIEWLYEQVLIIARAAIS